MPEQKIKVIGEGDRKKIKLTDIEFGNYIVVQKNFVDGKEVDGKFGKSFLCKVTYEEEDVALFLSPTQHDMFVEVGGQGDSVAIHRFVETANNKPATRYRFERVE